jgi:hypothetical protein
MDDKITIPFTREANGYKYRDCLILSKEHTFTEEEIIELQNRRFSQWMAHLDAASNIATPVEEIQDQIIDNLPSAGE